MFPGSGTLAKAAAARPGIFRTRNALLLGFGGLILLLAISGLDALQAIGQLRSTNDAIRREFLARDRRLEKIRSALYLSGTYVRDYLLEPDPAAAERHRASLTQTRQQIQSEMNSFRTLLRPEQSGPFDRLEKELDAYWQILDPLWSWDAPKRHQQGYAFLRDEVFPRRMNMLSVADRIGDVNAEELTAGERRVNETFDQFRTRLVFALAITVMLGFLQAVATSRMILQLERQTRAHLDEVTRARAELRELSARLVAAQEEERKSISRELHDAVGQSMSAVLFELRNMAASLPPGPGPVRDHVDTVRKLVEGSVGMVRNMALLLRPSMLDDLGLVPALEWQAREVSKRSGIVINVAAPDIPETLPDAYKTCIYRVVQEALNNISKHSGARTVRITVDVSADSIHLSVQDDGKGFDPARQKGLGLVGIQERVTGLNGTLRVESAPERGTMLVVWLPLPDGATASDNAI